jgi:MarR family 2-MHQ and catechol resistance regulon transcriptional repressor
LRACESEFLRAAGLTESQFGVLEALDHLGPLCQTDLAAKILRSVGNLTTVIGNLERRGLVTRRIDAADRRVRLVELTSAGRSLIRSVFPDHARALVEALAVLTAEEQTALGELCKKLGTRRPE